MTSVASHDLIADLDAPGIERECLVPLLVPDANECPLGRNCLANALGIQEERPVKIPKAEIPHHTVTAAILQQDGQVLIAQRPPEGLLGGMWEFPGGKVKPGEDLVACISREIREELSVEITVGREIGVYQHAYTHCRVTLHAFLCGMNGGEPRNLYHTALAGSVTTLEDHDHAKPLILDPPLQLGQLGLELCEPLLVRLVRVTVLRHPVLEAVVGGGATMNLPIPNNAALAGFPLTTQAAVGPTP